MIPRISEIYLIGRLSDIAKSDEGNSTVYLSNKNNMKDSGSWINVISN